MPELHQLEILLNLLFQGLGNWLYAPASFFSFLGSEEFFLLVTPILFWCISPLVGLRLGVVLILSNATNMILKMAFHSPRPYWIDSRVHAYAAESTFGIPSGHSQNAAAIWGFAASLIRKRWATIAILIVILLIGLSRIYLGVHFLSDLLAGWLCGGLLLVLILRLEKPLAAWVKRTALPGLLTATLLSSLAIILAAVLTSASLSAWPLPAEWSANALAAAPNAPIDPLSLENAFTLGGTLLGTLAGSAWIFRKAGGYSASGSLTQKAQRYLLGGAVLLVLWYGLGKIFPRDATLLAYGLRYLRYALIGSWITLFAPLLFRRLKWME